MFNVKIKLKNILGYFFFKLFNLKTMCQKFTDLQIISYQFSVKLLLYSLLNASLVSNNSQFFIYACRSGFNFSSYGTITLTKNMCLMLVAFNNLKLLEETERQKLNRTA